MPCVIAFARVLGRLGLNNQSIYIIDSTQTIITYIKNNIAKGFIVQSDLSLTSCYIVKEENQFAHGKTIKEAIISLQEKLLLILPIEERITRFLLQFSKINKKYKAIDFFNWHSLLTGSCKIGKESFIKDKNINLKEDNFTVKEFINLTKNNYGSDIIKQLEKQVLKT